MTASVGTSGHGANAHRAGNQPLKVRARGHSVTGMRTLLALALLSSTCAAAELQIRDIRLEIGQGTVSNYDAEFRYRAGPNSLVPSQTVRSTEWTGSDPGMISILYSSAHLAPFGFLWAAGGEFQSSDEDVDGESFSTIMAGAKVRLGVGWTPAPNWRVEATAEGHLGYISSEDADVTNQGLMDRADATGSYSALGLQVGGGYAFKGHWEVGASLRALGYQASTSADFSATGGSYDADYSWLLWSAAITGGYRF